MQRVGGPAVTTVEQTPVLTALLDEVSSKYAAIHWAPPVAVIEPAEAVLTELLRSLMAWEAPAAKAAAAVKKVESHVVDYNELRVCLADEVVSMIGERYPRAQERCQRLRAMLGDLYSRTHAVTLEHLLAFPKREARAYLDSLDGMVPFVAARVTLLCMGCHAAPVDERLLAALVGAGAMDACSTPESAAGTIERRVRAGELVNVYLRLHAWADDGGSPPCKPKVSRQPARKPERPGRE